MLLIELYKILQEETKFDLIGELSYDGLTIKWYYDSFNNEFEDNESELEHLHRILEEDVEIINDFISLEHLHVSHPTIEDTYVSFYIEE